MYHMLSHSFHRMKKTEFPHLFLKHFSLIPSSSYLIYFKIYKYQSYFLSRLKCKYSAFNGYVTVMLLALYRLAHKESLLKWTKP